MITNEEHFAKIQLERYGNPIFERLRFKIFYAVY
jgi:hypothetical protein